MSVPADKSNSPEIADATGDVPGEEPYDFRVAIYPEYWLFNSDARQGPRVFPLTKHISQVGRGRECEVFLANDSIISRYHCEIEIADCGVTVRDLKSTNGTLINGEKIQSRTLPVGASLQVGHTVLTLENRTKSNIDMIEAFVKVNSRDPLTSLRNEKHLLTVMLHNLHQVEGESAVVVFCLKDLQEYDRQRGHTDVNSLIGIAGGRLEDDLGHRGELWTCYG